MRAIWSGSISFGLINIPVKLYSAAESRDGIDLRMLHKTDQSPIRYAKICKKEGKEVPFDEIVKGYEYAKNQFVVLTDEDFESADTKQARAIEIAEFTEEQQIDVRYLEKPYYIEPQKGAEKPYALLREALKQSKKLAVARFVLHEREHLAAIKPVGQVLVLNQMRFPADLRMPGGLKLPTGAVDKQQLKMALALVEQLSAPFIAEDFHDTYTEKLEGTIEAKVKGRPAPKPDEAAPAAPAQDLMAALKKSLETAGHK